MPLVRMQKGNPIIAHIRNVTWEYGDIGPDYQVGATTGLLFLRCVFRSSSLLRALIRPHSASLRYHLLHPEYIHNRIEKLGQTYSLRLMLVMCDVDNYTAAMRELTKVCIVNGYTMIVCWTYVHPSSPLSSTDPFAQSPRSRSVPRAVQVVRTQAAGYDQGARREGLHVAPHRRPDQRPRRQQDGRDDSRFQFRCACPSRLAATRLTCLALAVVQEDRDCHAGILGRLSWARGEEGQEVAGRLHGEFRLAVQEEEEEYGGGYGGERERAQLVVVESIHHGLLLDGFGTFDIFILHKGFEGRQGIWAMAGKCWR